MLQTWKSYCCWNNSRPKEPKHHINSLQQPLVDDLIDLWDGVILDTNFSGTGEMFWAAILALSSGVPATRKCGGFIGHTVRKVSAQRCTITRVFYKILIITPWLFFFCICVCISIITPWLFFFCICVCISTNSHVLGIKNFDLKPALTSWPIPHT